MPAPKGKEICQLALAYVRSGSSYRQTADALCIDSKTVASIVERSQTGGPLTLSGYKGLPSGKRKIGPEQEECLLEWLEEDETLYLCELQVLLQEKFPGKEFSLSCVHDALARLELTRKQVRQAFVSMQRLPVSGLAAD